MITLQYGGDLQIGDFVAISYASGFTLGWVLGKGKTGTLQFIEYRWPISSFDKYIKAKTDKAYYHHERANKEEFSAKWLHKSYVQHPRWRAIKIENPESLFTEKEDLNNYLESKQVLQQINLLK